MSDGIFLSGAAMISQQARQEALVNNIANSSTPGYKAAHVFADVLEEVAGTGSEAIRAMERDKFQYIDFGQGAIRPTGRPLDMALDGKGFFVVLTPDGERYTRNGNFTLDGEGTLVTQEGHPVVSESGPLTLEAADFTINDKGEVLVGGEPIGALQVRDFSNPENLIREGSGLFAPAPNRSLVDSEVEAKVCQGCLEESNVSGTKEMVRMMALLKQFEAAGHTLKLQNSTIRRPANELITG